MIVWTMQPLAAIDQIRETGVFRCEPQRSWNLTKADSLKDIYGWLTERMQQKIGHEPEGVVSPVWAWHTWNFERKSPDPESAAFLRRDTPRVLMTLDIPEQSLVLTDFDAWQNVMMHMIVPNAVNEKEFQALTDRLETLTGAALEAEIRQSWENVFLIDRVDNEYLTRGRYIQATFWEIRADYIRDIRELPPNA